MYTVVRHIDATWHREDAGRRLAVGGDHDDLHEALVEASARNLIDTREGLAPTWSVESDRDEDYDEHGRLEMQHVRVEPAEIRGYLKDGLGLSEDEVRQLL